MGSRFVVQDKNDGAAINNLADRVNTGERSVAVAASGANSATVTAAQLIGGVYQLTGGTTATLTTPTAAQIVAALKNAEVGSAFDFVVTNANSGTATLAGGTGVTLSGVATAAATFGMTWRGIVTNATAGTEAVTMYRATA